VPFAVHCLGCGVLIKAPDKAAGKTLLCPRCKTPVTFPDKPPAPAPAAPAPAPATVVQPPAPTTAVQPPPVIPRLELDDDPLEEENRPVFRDFELVEDAPLLKDDKDFEPVVSKSEMEDLEEVLPVEDDEDVDQLEEVEDLDELEEVPEPARRRRGPSWLEESRLLRLRRVFLRGRKLSLGDALTYQDESVHDLIDPERRKKLGEAVEVRDSTTAALRIVAKSMHAGSLVPVHVEIREGRDLLATVYRPPNMSHFLIGRNVIEIKDVDGRVIGVFEDRAWAQLFSRPLYITNERGDNLLQIQSEGLFTGRMHLRTARGAPAGGVQVAGKGGFRLQLVRGFSYHVHFTEVLDDRPEDKLRFLAAIMGMFLLARDR
jgi:hypothetical protein